MYICPEIRVIYLAQPRCASRSLAQFLQANTPMRHSGQHHSMDIAELRFRRNDGWKVVSVVRNHWDIIVSWWHHNPHWFTSKTDKSFGKFARDFCTHTSNDYVTPHAMYGTFQPECTHIVRFESLWDEFSEVVGIPAPLEKRPRVGISDRKPYREYYDAETRDFIGEYYAAELERYGYGF